MLPENTTPLSPSSALRNLDRQPPDRQLSSPTAFKGDFSIGPCPDYKETLYGNSVTQDALSVPPVLNYCEPEAASYQNHLPKTQQSKTGVQWVCATKWELARIQAQKQETMVVVTTIAHVLELPKCDTHTGSFSSCEIWLPNVRDLSK